MCRCHALIFSLTILSLLGKVSIAQNDKIQSHHIKEHEFIKQHKKATKNTNHYKLNNIITNDSVLIDLPEKVDTIYFNDSSFYYKNGIWYKSSNQNFVVFRPNFSISTSNIPANSEILTLKNKEYYYFNGIFYNYKKKLNKYFIVTPPLKAKVKTIPKDFEEIIINNKTFFKIDNCYFSFIKDENIYQVQIPNK